MPPIVSPDTAVVVDADLCLPPALAAAAGIRVAPPDAPLLLERENIPRLKVEAAAGLDVAPLVEACRAAAATGARTIIYVPAQDGFGSPDGASAAAAEALAPLGVRFEVFETGEALMAAGWRAVILAESLRGGADPEAAMAHARAASISLLALVEHPELAAISGPDGSTTQRLVARLHGAEFRLVGAPAKRDDGLRSVRDGFARATSDVAGHLRVAVLHAGVVPAGEAMATWIRRERPTAEVYEGAVTRHQATRLGPGFVGICWAEVGAEG
ncbi:MAG: hypothetical protein AMXMBFR23_14240 [Chloroflexota bacterium]